MISIFRHHLQGRGLRYTIYFISFLVAFPMVISIFFRWFDPEHGQWAVKVNGSSVSMMDYQTRSYEIDQQIERLKRMLGPNADQLLAMQGLLGDTRKLVINALVTQKLFDETAQAQALYLSPAFVSQHFLQSLPKELITPSGTVDAKKLAQLYGMNVAHLEKETAQRLQQQQLLSLSEGALYIPQFQRKQQYMAQHAQRSFMVATFTHADLIAHSKQSTITDADIQAFFDSENKKTRRYWVPEERTAIVWEFEPEHYGVVINDEQINKYYNRNKYQQFVDQPATIQVRTILLTANDVNAHEVRAKLTALRQELVKDPTQFARKAQEISEDASKKNGGLLPAFARGTHDPLFEQAAFALAKEGDISSVIQTKRGLQLAQLIKKNAQTYKPIEKVRDTIVKGLRGERFNQFFGFEVKRAIMQENREQALADLAQRKGGKKRVVQLAARDVQAGAYQQKIFGLGKGAGSSVIDGNKGYAVLVTDISKTYKPVLEKVKATVVRDLHEFRAQQALQSLLNQCQRQATKQSFEQLVQSNGGKLSSTGMINIRDEKQSGALRKQLGATFARLEALTVPGSFVAHNAADKAYLVRLDQVSAFDEAQFKEHQAEFMPHMISMQKRLLEQAFVASLFKNATIKVNEQLVK